MISLTLLKLPKLFIALNKYYSIISAYSGINLQILASRPTKKLINISYYLNSFQLFGVKNSKIYLFCVDNRHVSYLRNSVDNRQTQA